MRVISSVLINVVDSCDDSREIEFEVEINEEVVKDFLEYASNDYGKFEDRDIDDWAIFLCRCSEFREYVEEVYADKINEQSYYQHHMTEFDSSDK